MKYGWVIFGIGAVIVVALLTWQSRQLTLPLTPLVRNEPFEVEVKFPDGVPRVGQTRHAHVRVGKEGQAFDVYGNGYALHFIMANPDFSSFLHTVDLHQDELGVYGTDVTMGPPRQYRVWVEVNDAKAEQKHGEAAPLIAFIDFSIPQETASFVPLTLVRGKEAPVGPYTVALVSGALKAGQESTWEVQVKDAQGRVQTLLNPEPAIAVILGPRGDNEFSFFRHGHAAPAVGGTTIRYTDTFPVPGEYLHWMEIYLLEGENLAKLQVPFVLGVSK